MLFPQHFGGGLIAGAGVCAAQYYCQRYTTMAFPIVPYWLLLSSAFFFALFPDLDTASIPQRWFYRCLLVALLTCVYLGLTKIGIWLAIFSILPLLDHHRGWTHHKLAPFIVPVLLLLLVQIFSVGLMDFIHMNIDQVLELAQRNFWLLTACTLGWLTHLLLDMRLS